MKKILTILITGLLFVSCHGEMKYKGNYEDLIVVSVKFIEVPRSSKSGYTKGPICKYKVRNYDPEGYYSMDWTFVDEMGKFEVGDTLKIVKK